MVNSTWFIYVLRDPRDSAIRYVGRTRNIRRRLSSHMRNRLPCLASWLEELESAGVSPTIEVIAEAQGRFAAHDLEAETIASFVSQHGDQILNRHYRFSQAAMRKRRDEERLARRVARSETLAMRREMREILSPRKVGKRTQQRIIEHDGHRLNLTQWAKRLGISKERVRQRVNKYPVEIALRPRLNFPLATA